MSANYSEALEQQVALLRWLSTPSGKKWFESLNEIADANAIGAGWTDPGIREWIHKPLASGDTFWWPTDIMRFVEHAAAAVPQFKLSLSLLPSPAGCNWYRDHEGQAGLAGFLWQVLPHFSGGQYVSMTWCPWNQVRNGPVPMGPLLWEEGATWMEALDAHVARAEGIGDDRDTRHVLEVLYRRFAAMLLFLDQKILVTRRQHAERHTRKRLDRDGWQQEPLIRVVELRRKERIGEKHAVERVEHEWSCQWIVRGHWRQQPYPKAGDVRPLWITPYVKGDPAKPLKPPRATVFAVVR